MALETFGWNYFCKTGDIDSYLLYRSVEEMADSSAPQDNAHMDRMEPENGTH